MLGLCVYIFSVNRSIDHLLRKWNLQCENVPLSTFSSVQVFNSSTQEEIQHDEQSFQMLVISRRSTWRICTVSDVRSMFMEQSAEKGSSQQESMKTGEGFLLDVYGEGRMNTDHHYCMSYTGSKYQSRLWSDCSDVSLPTQYGTVLSYRDRHPTILHLYSTTSPTICQHVGSTALHAACNL